jgi:hypothetical protein
MKGTDFILLGAFAIAAFILYKKRKGENEYVVTEDIVVPQGSSEPVSDIPVTRPENVRENVARISNTSVLTDSDLKTSTVTAPVSTSTRTAGERVVSTSTARRDRAFIGALSASDAKMKRIRKGNVIVGVPATKMIDSPPGFIGPVMVKGVNIKLGDKTIFVDENRLNRIA